VGFPLLIKAVAGGGGKGMRAVHSADEFQDALMAAQREGQASFGNAAVLLEKLIQRPRHVEVQVFADQHGNVVHLFERDCSLQRRHQKVIEEAPAPGLSERLRHILGIAAATAATAIGYEGAGTVEFILDMDAADKHGDPLFYFMEMNTRLQVEHPVTECITGFDLVEWQLRVARGEMLPAHQDAIAITGHAVEARLYAEDAEGGFLPSTGTLSALAFGSGPFSEFGGRAAGGVRIDTGVETGSRIGLDYDPMIAKVIAWGPDRATAIDRLVGALGGTQVEGLKSNRAFLARLADHPAFRAGDVDTGFIARHAEALAPAAEVPETALLLAALAIVLDTPLDTNSPFGRSGFRLNLREERSIRLWNGDALHPLSLRPSGGGRFHVAGLDSFGEVSAQRSGNRISVDCGGTLVTGHVLLSATAAEVRLGGQTHGLARRAPRKGPAAGAGDGRIIAPMPGRVLAIDVAPGQRVEAGDRLLVLEAMKMEHRITARSPGTIDAVHIATGDQVADGMLLVEIA
jgi:3-methylcrotonyl-CoA carboxylase alpha subunit